MKLLKLGFFYGTFKFNIYVCGGIIVAIQWDVSAMWQSYCYVQLTYENKSLKEKKKVQLVHYFLLKNSVMFNLLLLL